MERIWDGTMSAECDEYEYMEEVVQCENLVNRWGL